MLLDSVWRISPCSFYNWKKTTHGKSCSSKRLSRRRTIYLWIRGHRLFTASEGPKGFRGPAILIRGDFASAFNVSYAGSGVRWVAAAVPGVALLLSIHLPHKRQTFLQFLEVLQEVRNFVDSKNTDNLKLIIGIDANVQMSACLDYLRVGPAVPYETDDFNHSTLQRASSLFEWLTDRDLRLVNTFMDDERGRITTRDDWSTGSTSQIDFVISSSSLICVDTGVDEHMDFTSDHRPVWANFQFTASMPELMFPSQQGPRVPLNWKPGPTWNDAAACFDWNWTSNWSDISSKWCELATLHQLRKSQRYDKTLMALLQDRRCAANPEERRTLNKMIWRYRRKRKRRLLKEAIDATLSGAKKPVMPKSCVINWHRICGTSDPKIKLEERFTELYALTPEDQSKENDEKQYWIQRWLEVCDDPESVQVPRVFTPQKMSERIHKLRPGKGSPDGCTAELFYGLPKAAVCSLAVFFTSVLFTLQIPHVWTQGKATLIPKVVAPTSLEKYRGIACLTAARKLLGYLILTMLPDLVFFSVQCGLCAPSSSCRGGCIESNVSWKCVENGTAACMWFRLICQKHSTECYTVRFLKHCVCSLPLFNVLPWLRKCWVNVNLPPVSDTWSRTKLNYIVVCLKAHLKAHCCSFGVWTGAPSSFAQMANGRERLVVL